MWSVWLSDGCMRCGTRRQQQVMQTSDEYFRKEQYDALIQLSMIGYKRASDNIKPSGRKIFRKIS